MTDDEYAPFRRLEVVCEDAVSKVANKDGVVWAPKGRHGQRVTLIVAPDSHEIRRPRTGPVTVVARNGTSQERVLGGDAEKPTALMVASAKNQVVVLCFSRRAA